MGQGPHSSKLVVICVVLLLFVLFYVLFVCKGVLYYCHRVSTQLQLTNISYHTIYHIKCAKHSPWCNVSTVPEERTTESFFTQRVPRGICHTYGNNPYLNLHLCKQTYTHIWSWRMIGIMCEKCGIISVLYMLHTISCLYSVRIGPSLSPSQTKTYAGQVMLFKVLLS